RNKNPDTQIIMITAYASPDTAVEAIKRGAIDYISKPFEIRDIKKIINTVKNKLIAQANPEDFPEFELLVGNSKAISLIKESIRKIAPYDVNVLITGETGTGKEVAAREIHNLSKRKDKPFIAVNCAAIPHELLESELFGYIKGAFTGAEKNKKGLIEEAEGGTLFLDEIGELPLTLQSKLLRFLETKKFRPVGSTKEISTDVRIISATNRNLKKEIEEGRFREDLYYRLSTITLRMPSLKERKEDIPLIISHILKELNQKYNKNITRISPQFLEYVNNLELKGNIRELKNIIEKSVILSENDTLNLFEFEFESNLNSIFIDDPNKGFVLKSFPAEGVNLKKIMEEIEKTIIWYVYEKTGRNKTSSASNLGLTFREFRYRFDKYFH
ncbi:sigma-54 dependent transcriptional regulator, partial [Hydrogenivirga sp. 128-5-R1-1]|uniref:sigma-54-dependent transcriptional regulator n=1 Tax=Hydrogenivirga sp. 128-5-R1-1 TaxID=392423 RepID=UPI00015F0731